MCMRTRLTTFAILFCLMLSNSSLSQTGDEGDSDEAPARQVTDDDGVGIYTFLGPFGALLVMAWVASEGLNILHGGDLSRTPPY
jgi:hypothetical protein